MGILVSLRKEKKVIQRKEKNRGVYSIYNIYIYIIYSIHKKWKTR